MTPMPGQRDPGALLQKPATPLHASPIRRLSPFFQRLKDLGPWDAIFTHPIEYSLSSYKTREGIQQLFLELESKGFYLVNVPKGVRNSTREFYFNRNMCNGKPTGKSAYGIFVEFKRDKVRVMYTDPLAPEKGGNRLKAEEVLINREYKFNRKTGHWTMHDGTRCDNCGTWIAGLCNDIVAKASHKREDTFFANMHGHWGRDIDGKRLIKRYLDDGFSSTKNIIRNMMLWNIDIDATGFHNHFIYAFFNYVKSLEEAVGITKVPAFELTAPVVLYNPEEVRKFVRSLERLKGRLDILGIGGIESKLKRNRDGTYVTALFHGVVEKYSELAKMHNAGHPKSVIRIPSLRPMGYDEAEMNAFAGAMHDAGIDKIPLAKLASRLVPKGDGTYPNDLVRRLAFACEGSISDYNKAHPPAHITLPLQSTGEYDAEDVAHFISSLRENGAQMRDVGAARLLARLKRRPEGGYYLRDTEALMWAFSNSVAQHNWLLAKLAQKEGKARAEQIRIPKPEIMGYDMREAQAFLMGLKQNSASLETLTLFSLEKRLEKNMTNAHFKPSDVRAVLRLCSDAVQKHNKEGPQDRITMPQPKLNGPHFMVYCASAKIADEINREYLLQRTANYPPEAPSWEMKEMAAGINAKYALRGGLHGRDGYRDGENPTGTVAKYGLRAVMALSHPRANRHLKRLFNDDMVNAIAKGDISMEDARDFVGTRCRAVAGVNVLNRTTQVVDPAEFKNPAEGADITQIFYKENAEMNGALGKLRNPNAVSWAFARMMQKKYQTAVIFEPDLHYYPPVRCGETEMSGLALGYTALRGSARKSAAAFVLHLNAQVMFAQDGLKPFRERDPLLESLLADEAHPDRLFVSKPEITMAAYYEPNKDGILAPVEERTKRNFLQACREPLQKFRVYGTLALGIIAEDFMKRMKAKELSTPSEAWSLETVKTFWQTVLDFVD